MDILIALVALETRIANTVKTRAFVLALPIKTPPVLDLSSIPPPNAHVLFKIIANHVEPTGAIGAEYALIQEHAPLPFTTRVMRGAIKPLSHVMDAFKNLDALGAHLRRNV